MLQLLQLLPHLHWTGYAVGSREVVNCKIALPEREISQKPPLFGCTHVVLAMSTKSIRGINTQVYSYKFAVAACKVQLAPSGNTLLIGAVESQILLQMIVLRSQRIPARRRTFQCKDEMPRILEKTNIYIIYISAVVNVSSTTHIEARTMYLPMRANPSQHPKPRRAY